MKYRLLVRTWSMSFLKEDNGYRFEGTKLNFDISPKKKVRDLFESNLLLTVESFNFGEITPNPNKEAHVSKIISEIFEDGGSPSDSTFMSVAIKHSWATLNQPKSTLLNIHLNGLQIVLDREVMKGFYKFLSDDIITVVKEDHKREKMEKEVRKLEKQAQNEDKNNKDGESKIEKQLDEFITKIKPPKMSDYFYWFNSSDVSVTVNNYKVIVPKDYYVRNDGIQLNRELRAYSKKVSFINLAEWNTVPYLTEALNTIPNSALKSFTSDGSAKSNKFQLTISDMVMDTLDPQKEGSLDTILLPTTLNVYGRFIEKKEGV